MQYTDGPFHKENRDKYYNFYAFVVDKDQGDDNNKYQIMSLAEHFNAYTTNEWYMRMYIKQISGLFNDVQYQVYEYHHMTFDEFQIVAEKETGVSFGDGELITADTVEFTGDLVFSTIRISEDMDEFYNSYSDISDFSQSFVELYELINKPQYRSYFTKEFEPVRKLISRIVNVYLLISILAEVTNEHGNAFYQLPDHMKLYLTKLANFPMPIEDYEYYSLQDWNYLLLYYLREYWGLSYESPRDE